MTEETPDFKTTDETFAKVKAGFEIFGIPLAPYSFTRKSAANSMGILHGSIPPDKMRKVEGLFRYAGDLGDTIKVLWLCTIPNASEIQPAKTFEERRALAQQWTVQRAERMPDEAYAAAQEWAQSVGIMDDEGEKFWEAYFTFLGIMQADYASRFKVTTDSHTPVHEDDPDPNA